MLLGNVNLEIDVQLLNAYAPIDAILLSNVIPPASLLPFVKFQNDFNELQL